MSSCYFEPPVAAGQSKLEWLQQNTKELITWPTWEQALEYEKQGLLVVCCVNSGFYAVGLVLSKYDLERFQEPTDMRTKNWFAVRKSVAENNTPAFKHFWQGQLTVHPAP